MNNAATIREVRIVPFQPAYQTGVDDLLNSIEPEYEEPFYHPWGKKMQDLYRLPGRYYWVALVDDKVIGTAGVIVEKQYALLKSVFVGKAYRGAEFQVADKLLQTVTAKAIERHCPVMYLGTMPQFIAAQRFYEKHGYIRIDTGDMPADIPANDFDTVFYKRDLR